MIQFAVPKYHNSIKTMNSDELAKGEKNWMCVLILAKKDKTNSASWLTKENHSWKVTENSQHWPIIRSPFAAISIHHMPAVRVPWFWGLILKAARKGKMKDKTLKQMRNSVLFNYRELIQLNNLWWIRLPWITTNEPAFTSIGTKSFWSYDGKGWSKWTPSSSLMNLLTRPSRNKINNIITPHNY